MMNATNKNPDPDQAQKKAPGKNGRRPLLILLAIGTGVAVFSGGYMVLTAGQEDTDDAQVAADVVLVAARVSGPVVRVKVADNQQVKKGDVLCEIDAAEYVAKVKQQEAELLTAKAQADAADAQVQVVEANSRGGLVSAQAAVSGSSLGVSNADAMVAGARANLLRAQAETRRAELDLSRMRRLIASGAVAQERLDNAQVGYDGALAAQAQAQAQLLASEDSMRIARSRVAEARGRLGQSAPVDAQIATAHANSDLYHARVQSAEAQLELARLQLSYTQVLAPAEGVASKLTVHEGQLIQPGQAVVELVPNTTYVVANFKETQIGRMKPGQDVDVRIDAFSGRKFRGKLTSLSGGTGASFSMLPPDNASGNFVKVVQRVPVRVSWVDLTPGSDVVLRAGLSADVTVHTR